MSKKSNTNTIFLRFRTRQDVLSFIQQAWDFFDIIVIDFLFISLSIENQYLKHNLTILGGVYGGIAVHPP